MKNSAAQVAQKVTSEPQQETVSKLVGFIQMGKRDGDESKDQSWAEGDSESDSSSSSDETRLDTMKMKMLESKI